MRNTTDKMKKFLLFCLITMSANLGFAQTAEVDETQLIGKWTVTEIEGNPTNFVKSFGGFYLGDCFFDTGSIPGSDEWKYKAEDYIGGYMIDMVDYDDHTFYAWCLEDFFISNGNKLHIIFKDDHYDTNNALRFVIDSFTGGKMILSTYDGKCKIKLDKEGNTNFTPALDIPAKEEAVYYNLNGIKTSHPQRGMIYIKRESNSAEKIKF